MYQNLRKASTALRSDESSGRWSLEDKPLEENIEDTIAGTISVTFKLYKPAQIPEGKDLAMKVLDQSIKLSSMTFPVVPKTSKITRDADLKV